MFFDMAYTTYNIEKCTKNAIRFTHKSATFSLAKMYNQGNTTSMLKVTHSVKRASNQQSAAKEGALSPPSTWPWHGRVHHWPLLDDSNGPPRLQGPFEQTPRTDRSWKISNGSLKKINMDYWAFHHHFSSSLLWDKDVYRMHRLELRQY